MAKKTLFLYFLPLVTSCSSIPLVASCSSTSLPNPDPAYEFLFSNKEFGFCGNPNKDLGTISNSFPDKILEITPWLTSTFNNNEVFNGMTPVITIRDINLLEGNITITLQFKDTKTNKFIESKYDDVKQVIRGYKKMPQSSVNSFLHAFDEIKSINWKNDEKTLAFLEQNDIDNNLVYDNPNSDKYIGDFIDISTIPTGFTVSEYVKIKSNNNTKKVQVLLILKNGAEEMISNIPYTVQK